VQPPPAAGPALPVKPVPAAQSGLLSVLGGMLKRVLAGAEPAGPGDEGALPPIDDLPPLPVAAREREPEAVRTVPRVELGPIPAGLAATAADDPGRSPAHGWLKGFVASQPGAKAATPAANAALKVTLPTAKTAVSPPSGRAG
jgi:hypothetical protein